jgi:hypothetical protein
MMASPPTSQILLWPVSLMSYPLRDEANPSNKR